MRTLSSTDASYAFQLSESRATLLAPIPLVRHRLFRTDLLCLWGHLWGQAFIICFLSGSMEALRFEVQDQSSWQARKLGAGETRGHGDKGRGGLRTEGQEGYEINTNADCGMRIAE